MKILIEDLWTIIELIELLLGVIVQMFSFQIQDFVTLTKAEQSFFSKTLLGVSPDSNYK
jgi:hypothetical protein